MININFINQDKILNLGKKALVMISIPMIMMTSGCQNHNKSLPNKQEITISTNSPNNDEQKKDTTAFESIDITREAPQEPIPALEEPEPIININEYEFSNSGVSVYNTDFRISDELTSKINNAIKSFGGDCSFLVINLNDGMSFGYNVDKTYKTASTIKAAFSLYAFKEMDKGNGSLDELKTYEEKFRRDGSGKLQHRESGVDYTLKDLFYYTINYSDNVAYYMVHDRFYNDSYNDFLKELGCSELYLNYGAKWGKINARSMAIIWQEIYKYKDETENGKYLFELFTNAEYNYMQQGMDNLKSAHKSGWTPTEVHDSGIIFANDDYIFITLNNNNGNYSGKNQLLKISSCIEEVINEYDIYKNNQKIKTKKSSNY